MATVLSSKAAPPPARNSALPSLLAELQGCATSYLEPEAFFVSWQGVLVMAYRGFTQPLVHLKERISAAHPSLPPENPGSKWPKTSLGCLRDGRRLTPGQLELLCQICREESAAFKQHGQQPPLQQQPQAAAGSSELPGASGASATTAASRAAAETAAGAATEGDGDGIQMAVDLAAVVLFECRSLERLLISQPVMFQGGMDSAPPCDAELARVSAIVAEQDSAEYWFAASKDGHRESHYRGSHVGATLMHPLQLEPWGHEAHGQDAHAAAAAVRPGLQARGLREMTDRQALLAAFARFRRRVDAALPGMYAWFDDASLHITIRPLIN